VLYSMCFYINKYLLSTDNIKIQSLKVVTKSINTKADIKIPEATRNLKISYDGAYGAYVAYGVNKVLNIMDTKSGLKKALKLDNEASFYAWLPDRNRILIVEDMKKNNKRSFRLDYYDADRDEIGIISEVNAFNATAQITDLKVSTITNSIYIKAEDNNGKTQIYYLNIMKKLKKVKTTGNNIGNIEVIANKSNMAYEDSKNGRIYITNTRKPLIIDNVFSESLLGIDASDNVYIGEVKDNRIVNIYSGSLDAASIIWQPNELIAPVNKSDVYITKSGGMYVNIGLENTLYNLRSHEYIDYPGVFLQLIDGAIVSIDQEKLIITKLKEN
jgi:hypothetical protein